MSAGIRLLLVDDEEEFVSTLAERLEIRDLEVSTLLRGEEAVDLVGKQDFDVVILDVLMPGKGGIETLSEIKSLKPLTEVIMLTGHATVETAIEGMKLGAFDYLVKPVDLKDLVEKIGRAHRRKEEQEERIRKAEIDHIIKTRGW